MGLCWVSIYEPYDLGILGSGFLNQVPTLGFLGAKVWGFRVLGLAASGFKSRGTQPLKP